MSEIHQNEIRGWEIYGCIHCVLILYLGVLSILLIIAIGLVLFLTGLAPAGEQAYSFPEALWVGFLHTIPGDSVGGRESVWQYRFLMLGVMLFNIFFASIVIGALISGMQTRLEELKRGRTKVVESNHTVILGWSEQIITVLSELIQAHSLHRPRCVFQQFFRQTQLEQRGHWIKSGRISAAALSNASSWAFSQVAERARSPRLAAWSKMPPNRLPADSSALDTVPSANGWKRLRKPELQRSQQNSNWNPCSVLRSE